MDVTNEFFEKRGIAAALFGEGQEQGGLGLGGGAKKQRSHLGGIAKKKSIKGDVFEWESGLKKAVKCGEFLQKRAAVCVFAAEASEEHQRGWVGWSEEFEQKCGAIDIAPLEVVDPEHQFSSERESPQEFA